MAEAFARKYFPNANIFSAGIEKHGVNPNMLEVMRERVFEVRADSAKHADFLSTNFTNFLFGFCLTGTRISWIIYGNGVSP